MLATWFNESLLATARLTLGRRFADPKRGLRSAHLAPPYSFEYLYQTIPALAQRTRAERAMVTEVVREKIALAAASPRTNGRGHATSSLREHLSEGCFLIKRGFDLWDKLAFGETGGFFDENDTPPWDCWVDYTIGKRRLRGHWTRDEITFLVSWIPGYACALANEGVKLSVTRDLYWLDAVRSPSTFYDRLDQRLAREIRVQYRTVLQSLCA